MRKLIIATTAIAFLSSTGFAAVAQDKGTAAPAASGDSMSKGDMSKDKMAKKSKKSKKSSDDTTKQ
jgi:pentapeptide MXKDX repeat protein